MFIKRLVSIILPLLISNFYLVGSCLFSSKENPNNTPKAKKITKAQLVHMIDSLLEKETISPVEIKQLNFLSGMVKKEQESELVYLIDSLLEKDNISIQEINQLKHFSALVKNEKPVNNDVDFDDLNNLHFYSDTEEKKLFPAFSIDSFPQEFEILLENSVNKNYTNPFNGVLTSYYGWRDKRMHKGIDIDLIKGQPVMAAFDGKVRIAAKNNGGFGNVVIIMHANGLETVYAHLSKLKVKPGQVVLSGQTIGLGGNTGKSRGSHLHFETRYKGHALNPLHFIAYAENKLYHNSITLKVIKKTLTAFPSNAELHTVKKGESWNVIAKKYNMPVSTLLTLNGTARRSYLKAGTTLRIN